MRKLAVTALFGAASLALAACSGGETEANNTATDTGEEITDYNAGSGATAAGGDDFPAGARIVQENGTTYRVDPDGTRTALGDNDYRIVTENGVRYRVGPSGSRVRIDEQGLSVDAPDVDVDLPDVDVGINEKGNPDVDVKGGDVDVTTNDNR